MQIPFIVISALAGVLAGVLQSFMLSRVLKCFTDGKYKKALMLVPLKLLIYAVLFTAAAFLSRGCIIALGCGLGGGITVFAAVYCLLNINRR